MKQGQNFVGIRRLEGKEGLMTFFQTSQFLEHMGGGPVTLLTQLGKDSLLTLLDNTQKQQALDYW